MLKGYDGEAYKDHSWVAFLTHSLIDGSELNAFHIKNILSPDLCSVPRVLQPELKNAQLHSNTLRAPGGQLFIIHAAAVVY